jgi:trehalose/maltose hydrolase-like predicted phosphorylase
VPLHADGIISQFDGYEELAEFDWDRYRATYANIGRLDLILESEGDTTNRYRVSKQADVLILFYLISGRDTYRLLAALDVRLRRHHPCAHPSLADTGSRRSRPRSSATAVPVIP